MIRSPAGFDGADRIKRYLDYYQPSYGVMMLSAGQVAAFSPASLFASGEQGVWYDPSDMTTLFQDAAGTTPVTAVEQPVGLMLDKSRGLALGPELVTNGDFSSATGWSTPVAGCSITGGAFVFDGTTSITAGVTLTTNTPTASIVAGKTYVVTFTIVGGTTNNISIGVGGATTTPRSAAGTYTEYLTAGTNAAPYIVGRTVNGIRTGSIDNISVRELPGNHASQSTSASRPVLSARVNLLTRTEAFDDAAWTKTALNISPNTLATTDPLGGNTADIAIPNTVNTFHILDQRNITIAATGYTVSVYAKAAGYNFVIVQLASDNTFTSFFEGCFNISNGTIESTGRSVGYTGSRSISFVGNGWYRCTITVDTATANSTGRIQILPSSTNSTTTSYAGNGTSGVYFWGADLRVSNAGVNLPAYQRVNTSTDYDTAGFPMYLRFDGTDDGMATGTINPGSVDKAQVFAGVRKLSDGASISITAELSTNGGTNTGSFITFQSASNGSDRSSWASSTRGATGAFVRQGRTYAAPVTNVITTLHDIAGSTYATAANIRVNGAAPGSFFDEPGLAGPTGGGNFGSYPLYIGSRGGVSNRLNGHLYSLIVRFSATNLPDATIAQTETWVNGKTYAY